MKRTSLLVCGSCFSRLSAGNTDVERDTSVKELSPGMQCEAHPVGHVAPMASGAILVPVELIEAQREEEKKRSLDSAAAREILLNVERHARIGARSEGARGEETQVAAILLGSWGAPGKYVSDLAIAEAVDTARRLLAVTKGW